MLGRDYFILAVGEADLSYEKVKNMILNDEDRANDTKAHNEDAFTAQRENRSYKTDVETTKTEIKAFKVNAIIVNRKGILPKIVQRKQRMNSVRPVKQEVVLLVVQKKNVQLMKKKKN